jgi:hypothetical protein
MAVVAGSRSFRTESYADVHPPDNNGAYEDQVVPALRKRAFHRWRRLVELVDSILITEIRSGGRVTSSGKTDVYPLTTGVRGFCSARAK